MTRPPPLSCDCHIHVFGPLERYPLDPARQYTPEPALLQDYLEVAAELGTGRVVLVQPSVYGVDNACQRDALVELHERARGIAVIDDTVSDEALDELCAAGFVGARLNFARAADPESLKRTAVRVAPLGWHIQVHVPGTLLPELVEPLLSLPTEFVIDHFGRIDAHEGLEQPGFQALLRLLDSGRGWAKLSAPYRIDLDGPPWRKAAPFAHELVRRFPERLVWGSDWPHPDVAVLPEDQKLLDVLAEWVPGQKARHRILVENAQALYRF